MLPAFINQSVIQFKNTSLVSVISVADLAYMAAVVNGQTYKPLESYTIMALLYIAVLFPMTQIADYVERRLRANHADTAVGGETIHQKIEIRFPQSRLLSNK